MRDELELQISGLRAARAALEPDHGRREELGSRALDHALAYLDQVPEAPANRSWTEVFSRRLDPEFAEEGRDAAEVFDYVAACVDRPGFATTSPRFMAYIPGGGLFHSAIGAFLAAVSNKHSSFASARPGQARLETPKPERMANVPANP